MSTTHVWAVIQQWMDAQFFKVSQAALAEKVGVTRSAMSQWKSGQATPKPEHLRKLAEVTRVPYERFVEAVVRDLGYTSAEDGGEHARSAPITQPGPAGAAGHLSAVPDAGDTSKPEEGLEDEPPPFKCPPEHEWTADVQHDLDEHAKAARRGKPDLPPDRNTGEGSQLDPRNDDE